MGCSLSEQGTFELGHCYDAVNEYDIDTVLGVSVWGLLVKGTVRLVG